MNTFDFLNKRFWLAIALCFGLAGIALAGSREGTGSQSEETSGTSQGTTGTPGTSQGNPGSMEQSQEMGKMQSFQSLDIDKDNYVTKSELNDSPSLLKHFDKADADKNGQLEESEFHNLMMENER